jgi:hypothetical protein
MKSHLFAVALGLTRRQARLAGEIASISDFLVVFSCLFTAGSHFFWLIFLLFFWYDRFGLFEFFNSVFLFSKF